MRTRAPFTWPLSLTLSFVLLAVQSGWPSAAQSQALPRIDAVAIVELFTSEGCSSCPPADALLRQIDGTQTATGQRIVGISEHVTYWNRLGWTDPFSAQVFTDRQGRYAARLPGEGPYTPQMVLNGREQFVGSDQAALQRALRADAARPRANLRILALTSEGEALMVRFRLEGAPAGKPLDIVAFLTDDLDRSNVLSGENSGVSLEHVSVARSLSRVGTAKGETEETVRVSMPTGLQAHGSGGHHLVLLAQEQNQGAIIGAATLAF